MTAPDVLSEVCRLADRYCEGTLSEAESQRLRELLAGSDDLVEEFVLRTEMHAELTQTFRGLPAHAPIATANVLPERMATRDVQATAKQISEPQRLTWVVVGVALTLTIALAVVFSNRQPPESPNPIEPPKVEENGLWNSTFDPDLDVTPPSGWVTIDGDLGEWQGGDSSVLEADRGPKWKLSAELFARADARRLLIAAVVVDRHPLRNVYGPDANVVPVENGGGLRLTIARPNAEPVFVSFWRDAKTGRDHVRVGVGHGEPVTDPAGAEVRLLRAHDDRSYTVEAALPWEALRIARPDAGSEWEVRADVFFAGSDGNQPLGQIGTAAGLATDRKSGRPWSAWRFR